MSKFPGHGVSSPGLTVNLNNFNKSFSASSLNLIEFPSVGRISMGTASLRVTDVEWRWRPDTQQPKFRVLEGDRDRGRKGERKVFNCGSMNVRLPPSISHFSLLVTVLFFQRSLVFFPEFPKAVKLNPRKENLLDANPEISRAGVRSAGPARGAGKGRGLLSSAPPPARPAA